MFDGLDPPTEGPPKMRWRWYHTAAAITLVGATLGFGFDAFSKPVKQSTHSSTTERVPRPGELSEVESVRGYQNAKSGNSADKQSLLNQSFANAGARNLSEIVYDETLAIVENDLDVRLSAQDYSRTLRRMAIEDVRNSCVDETIMIPPLVRDIGNGDPQRAYALNSLFRKESVRSIDDVTNMLRYTDAIAEQIRFGYEIGPNKRMSGEELMKLMKSGEIRIDKMMDIVRLSGYAAQIQAIESGMDRVTDKCYEFAAKQLGSLATRLRIETDNGQMRPTEAEFSRYQRSKLSPIFDLVPMRYFK